MATVKVRYLVERGRKRRPTSYYWLPTKKLQEAGFLPRRLPSTLPEAIAAAEQLNAELDAWYRGEQRPPRLKEGSLAAVNESFQRDDDFARLAERSKRDYLYNIAFGLEWAGAEHVGQFTTRAVKGWYKHLKVHKGPATARNAMAAFRRLLTFAVSESLIPSNPALDVTVETPASRSIVWTDEERDRFVAQAREQGRPSMGLAVMLGAFIGQRPADLRQLSWSAYDGSFIRLVQAKTKRVVAIRCLPTLKAVIDATPRLGELMVISESTHRPYAESDFQHTFADIRKAAGLRDDLQFRDLRRTLATLLGAAGCTDDQIRAITGHKTRSVVAVYVRPDTTFAEGAMDRLERHLTDSGVEHVQQKRSTENPLSD